MPHTLRSIQIADEQPGRVGFAADLADPEALAMPAGAGSGTG